MLVKSQDQFDDFSQCARARSLRGSKPSGRLLQATLLVKSSSRPWRQESQERVGRARSSMFGTLGIAAPFGLWCTGSITQRSSNACFVVTDRHLARIDRRGLRWLVNGRESPISTRAGSSGTGHDGRTVCSGPPTISQTKQQSTAIGRSGLPTRSLRGKAGTPRGGRHRLVRYPGGFAAVRQGGCRTGTHLDEHG